MHVDLSGGYDAGITAEIDQKIRHMTRVEMYCHTKAEELKAATGSGNFRVYAQTRKETQRPRFYVAPFNREGIHEELSQAVLLKAALGMSGK
jgi:hypothetical protein